MKNILAKLFPSDRKYKSTVQIVSIGAGGNLNIEKMCHPADLPEKMSHFIFDSEKNYYIMANSTYPYQRRITENLFALNNLVIDLDIHDDNVEPYDRYRYIEEFAWRLKRDIINNDDPAFPAPHVIHYTGRGLQLWWHIEETSAQLLFVYREVMDLLLIALGEYLDECRACVGSLRVDVSTKNPVGIFRLFETTNIKTGRKTEYEYIDIPAYTLDALKESLLGNEAVATYLQKERQKKEKAVRAKRKDTENASEKSIDSKYTSLLQKRLWIIWRVASEMTQHEGVRNKYLLLAYSTARKIYSAEEAKTFCRELNNLFVPKIDRIEYIFRTEKIYKWSEENFCAELGISMDYYKELSAEYYANHSNGIRDRERKHRAIAREEQKKKAVGLLLENHTIKAIAAETGLSVTMVSRLSASLKCPPKGKPWVEMGMSRSTYYRRQKENTATTS